MGAIIPALLSPSRAKLEEQLGLVAGLVDTVQIDVVDGVFAGMPTWPFTEGGVKVLSSGFDIHDLGNFRYEMDLMVSNPESIMRAFLTAGAAKLILHAGSSENLSGLVTELEDVYGRDREFAPELLSVAIAVRAGTDIGALAPVIERVDYLQVMGITAIGKQGQGFDETALDRIRVLRKEYPDLLIQVDGGVSLHTAPRLLEAGANRLVVGSALWKSENIKETLHAFETIVEEYGQYR